MRFRYLRRAEAEVRHSSTGTVGGVILVLSSCLTLVHRRSHRPPCMSPAKHRRHWKAEQEERKRKLEQSSAAAPVQAADGGSAGDGVVEIGKDGAFDVGATPTVGRSVEVQ